MSQEINKSINQFYSYARQGISNEIDQKDNLNKNHNGESRASITTKINLTAKLSEDESKREESKLKSIGMFGPGEVIGVQARSIVRTHPRNNVTNFEPNYLPFIEFYDEDFPWRYTPASPNNGKLRPWLTIVICEEQGKGEAWKMNLPTVSELDRKEGKAVMLPYLSGDGIIFPIAEETWAWAHVQANRSTEELEQATAELKRINEALEEGEEELQALNEFVKKYPNRACSRLICPIKLKENTSYHAFLIPAFEQGRLAGLGANSAEINSIPAQLAAWILADQGQAQTPIDDTIRIKPIVGESPEYGELPLLDKYKNKWPIYHQWYFKTGKAVDMEYLAKILEPRELDERVGKRKMDISSPGWGLYYSKAHTDKSSSNNDGPILSQNYPYADILDATNTISNKQFLLTSLKIEDQAYVYLEGAIKRPNTDKEEEQIQPFLTRGGIAHHDHFVSELQELLNLNESSEEGAHQTVNKISKNLFVQEEDEEDDPIVTPPLYGRFHALRQSVSIDDNKTWFKELNLDPSQRVVAGLGTKVIQKNQEHFMKRAWQQVKEILEARKFVNRLNLGLEMNKKIKNKYLDKVNEVKFLGLTKALHGRVKYNGASLRSSMLDTKEVNNSVTSPMFSRISRAGSPAFKRMNLKDPSLILNTNFASSIMIGALGFQNGINQFGGNSISLDTITNLTGNINTDTLNTDFLGRGVASDVQEANAPEEMMPRGDSDTKARNTLEFDAARAKQIVNDVIIPKNSATRKYNAVLGKIHKNITPEEPIVAPIAYPEFPEPIYQELKALSSDLLLPNIHLIPPNTIALMETNQKFIEAYMMGLNHEMARELHWREYPTDRRGSYFRQFWDVSGIPDTKDENGEVKEKEDIHPIHTWKGELGVHKPADDDSNNLVLVIRGELLKRFPNVLITLHKAEDLLLGTSADQSVYPISKPNADQVLYPIFGAKVEPDIHFIGFDITPEEAKGDELKATEIVGLVDPPNPGWFVMISERPGEPRFGFDIPQEGEKGVWNAELKSADDLNWSHIKTKENGCINLSGSGRVEKKLGKFEWRKDAANMGAILHQKPYRIFIHASQMLP